LAYCGLGKRFWFGNLHEKVTIQTGSPPFFPRPLVLIVDPETKFIDWEEEIPGGHPERVYTGAFHRSRHLLEDLFERASRCYELLVLTLDVLAECFEQRDALGSHDEYSEDVCS